jgi:hypothetical protein
MAQQGGKRPVRTNSQPKAVSGPGKLSQRTDMVPSGGAYGERKDITDIMAQGNRATPAPTPAPNLPPITSLFAPTERPNEPVTAGVDVGAGPGSEAVQLPQRTFNVTQTFNRLAQQDPTGEIELILKDLQSRGIE